MIQTLASGVIVLVIAVTFLGVVLAKIHEPVLWIVVGLGVVMMVASLVEGIRADQMTADSNQPLPQDQQKRGGVS